MKPYPAYKPTGLAWLPEVPREWNCRKFKYLFSERSEKGFPNEPLLAATQNHGVILKTEYENRTVTAEKGLETLKLVKVGDFVISLRSFEGGIELSYRQGIISPAYTIIFSNGELTNGYFKWLGKSAVFIQLLKTCVTGIREGQNIDYGRLRVSGVPIPPPAEQEAIVAYLDEKTAKIDRLIELKEREIKLLNEKKQAVISKVVTRESGDTIAVKYLVQINNGSDPTTEGDTPVYGSGAESFKTCGEFKIGPTVLLGRKGATLHIPHYVAGKYWNVDTAFDVKPLTKELDLRFFYYCATCFDYRRFISQTTLPSMTKSDYGRMKIPRLSLPEQQKIVAYLDAAGAKTDKAIAAVTRQIGLLKEYRTRLISDAVTGRIDLRKL